MKRLADVPQNKTQEMSTATASDGQFVLMRYLWMRIEHEIDEYMRTREELAAARREIALSEEDIQRLEQFIDTLRSENEDLIEDCERLREYTVGHMYEYAEAGFIYPGLVVRVEVVGTQIIRWIKCHHSGKILHELQFNKEASRQIRAYQSAIEKQRDVRYVDTVENAAEYGPEWDRAGKKVEEELAWLLLETSGNYVHHR